MCRDLLSVLLLNTPIFFLLFFFTFLPKKLKNNKNIKKIKNKNLE
jgi:hypothetical protein